MENKLEDMIMVRKPYNILYDINEELDGSISGSVKNEFLYKDKWGPIGASEAGRHLAILGSMALANQTNSKKYYLAVHAKIKRNNLTVQNIDTLKLQSKVITHNKRDGEITGDIYDANNQSIYTANIKYKIFTPQVFLKLFGSFKSSVEIKNNISPYQKRKELSNITINKTEIKGDYGTILPHECEGHFNEYPALPVAIIANLLGELGIKLFLHNNSDFTKVIVTSASINAYRLAFHGEYVTFNAKVKNKDHKSISIVGEVKVGTDLIADAQFEVVGFDNIDNSI